MAAAWSAASMSLTRAGGASLVEQFEFEVPGIVIPYPFASEDHQSKNGDFLAQTGLGIKILEGDLTPQNLAMKIQEFYVGAQERVGKFQHYKQTHPIPPLSEGIMEALECR
jgi:UDP-N-acetylglucosamine--N-acetylmuramyl-(pentapeptide) pyrophosphoryl-undecaprenol N-acetylglucosamine transferase